ncbi:MAG: VWA domain-containing protein, partial [Pseudomonadota bacterium]
AGRLAAALDRGGVGVIALDERAEAGEAVPEALADRLALHVDLEGLALSDLEAPLDDATPDGVTPATEDAIEALTHTAAALAIPSLRAPMLALRVARALAGGAPSEADIATAARLVLAPRAEAVPAPPEDSDPPPPPPEPQENPGEAPESEGSGALEDRVLDAVRAILPADLIAEAADRARGQARAGEAGATREAPRGRPAGTRRAPQGTPQRLDVIATLRAAAPWQALRRRSTPGRRGTIVLAEDFRTKRHIRPAESVMIFLVDASGSAAAARLAEAKGAVEILLSRAYQRREKVALIAFRRDRAELLLPATRSLVQAKRRLATLPGGGGTPLAAGLMAGVALALQMRGRGITPHLTILTDGRGNVALDGTSDRGAAAEDTARAARAIRAEGLTATLIDTSNRPQQAAQELARTMGARYLALPRADAAGLATRLAPA